MRGDESIWSETAAWVEAIGAIAAVVGSGWVAASESRAGPADAMSGPPPRRS